MESIQKRINAGVIIQTAIFSVLKNKKDCKCRECSYPSCHDPVWNESYCQYHYNEEHYLSR